MQWLVVSHLYSVGTLLAARNALTSLSSRLAGTAVKTFSVDASILSPGAPAYLAYQ